MTSVALALLGGILLGFSPSLLLLFDGCATSASVIVAEPLKPARGEIGWRSIFIGGLFWQLHFADRIGGAAAPGLMATAVAGLLLGFGPRLSNGSTSERGVASGAVRSIVATITFMATGVATALVVRLILGGVR